MFVLLYFLAGGIVGYFVAYTWLFQGKSRRQLENQLAEKEAELNRYQNEVAAHFETTAELFTDLQLQQDKLVQHLTEGAQALRHETFRASAPQYIVLQKRTDDAPKDYPLDKSI